MYCTAPGSDADSWTVTASVAAATTFGYSVALAPSPHPQLGAALSGVTNSTHVAPAMRFDTRELPSKGTFQLAASRAVHGKSPRSSPTQHSE
eukprot:1538357-Pyramimonas_sp.AAC.1